MTNFKKILTIMAILVCLAWCLWFFNTTNKYQQKAKQTPSTNTNTQIEWKTSDNGISYFIDCVEGYKFIVTKSTHQFYQLAGPIDKCYE